MAATRKVTDIRYPYETVQIATASTGATIVAPLRRRYRLETAVWVNVPYDDIEDIVATEGFKITGARPTEGGSLSSKPVCPPVRGSRTKKDTAR